MLEEYLPYLLEYTNHIFYYPSIWAKHSCYYSLMKKGFDYPGITVMYFCHDGAGSFVMAKRGNGCRDENGNWDAGAGGLELGDTVENTLRKEIKEEYCADVLEYEFLGYRDIHRVHNGENTHWISLDFKVLVDRSTVANGEPHKFDDVAWFTLHTLPTPLHSQMQNFIEKYGNALR